MTALLSDWSSFSKSAPLNTFTSELDQNFWIRALERKTAEAGLRLKLLVTMKKAYVFVELYLAVPILLFLMPNPSVGIHGLLVGVFMQFRRECAESIIEELRQNMTRTCTTNMKKDEVSSAFLTVKPKAIKKLMKGRVRIFRDPLPALIVCFSYDPAGRHQPYDE